MRLKLLSAITLLCISSSIAFAQTTEFTYQGKLNDGGTSANGAYDLEFRLFDVLNGSTALAVQQKPGVLVTGGIFTVQLDFGATFTGVARYLEIAIATSGGSLTTLTPRQPITSAPYSI